ncbi:hypothetical protein AAFF_G00208880 [Aldrovandia affinis]|uniref:inositol-1,4-bisphosphate 1-phosphatase n=1 Tax=Aldrovandia affinis TaxID=143900 RepID=A0AAD7RHN2_9TELE|nr:hypothetical protein AAFF_G00208880 [Aldrovandia affinis]
MEFDLICVWRRAAAGERAFGAELVAVTAAAPAQRPDSVTTRRRAEMTSPPQTAEMSELVRALVRASEKAANIARACRQEESLFGLLIEEKKEGEKNKKFVTDFKTLADVLVQEVIRHDIGKQFPGLANNIFGEESNEFMNGLGEKIEVRVCETEQDTSRLGLWVDPIDSTLQYIRGLSDCVPQQQIFSQGLQCVTVLIGVYHLQTGAPVMGVINQPFSLQDPETLRWTGQYYWGVSSGLCNVNSIQSPAGGAKAHPGSALTASGQQGALHSAVLSTGETEYVYVFSEDTTFRWDCCAAHAILRSLGGGVADLKECLRLRHAGTLEDQPELAYHRPVGGATGAERWANQGGLVAYRSRAHLDAVLELLANIPL